MYRQILKTNIKEIYGMNVGRIYALTSDRSTQKEPTQEHIDCF